MQPGVVPGAVLELHAARAAGGVGPGINSPLTTTFYDTTENGNDGTLTGFSGSPWLGSGIISDPYRLHSAGGSRIIDCGTPASLDISGDITLEMWLAMTGGDVYAQMLGRINQVALRHDGNTRKFYFTGTGIGTVYFDATFTRDGVLRHIVAQRQVSSGLVRCYVNASQIGSDQYAAAGTSLSTGDATAALNVPASGRSVIGDLTIARIYSGFLTPSQVAQNHNAGPLWLDAGPFPVVGRSPLIGGMAA